MTKRTYTLANLTEADLEAIYGHCNADLLGAQTVTVELEQSDQEAVEFTLRYSENIAAAEAIKNRPRRVIGAVDVFIDDDTGVKTFVSHRHLGFTSLDLGPGAIHSALDLAQSNLSAAIAAHPVKVVSNTTPKLPKGHKTPADFFKAILSRAGKGGE